MHTGKADASPMMQEDQTRARLAPLGNAYVDSGLTSLTMVVTSSSGMIGLTRCA